MTIFRPRQTLTQAAALIALGFAGLVLVPGFDAHAQDEVITADPRVERVFRRTEKCLIEEFFRSGGKLPDSETVARCAAQGTETVRRDHPEDRDRHHGDRKKSKSARHDRQSDGDLPPGLAKRDGDLPPGLQKQLERTGRLPPGLEKRRLPDDLEAALPPLEDGTDRHVVGRDVVLIETATGVILDILRDVVREE